MHADSPSSLSLFDADYFATVAPSGRKCVFDCSREQAVYMSFDDHEVVDNFESRVDHAAEHFRALRQGALDAAWDYQGLRIAAASGSRPASMHFASSIATGGASLRQERPIGLDILDATRPGPA